MNGREVIWDPLRKKEVALTPEEKVRQWCINVLSSQCAVPMHMMMSEAGFKLGGKQFRADILIYDSTYTPEDYPRKKGWGHSTWLEGLKLKEAAGVKKLLLAHHEIDADDALLDSLQTKLAALDENVYLAKEGMEITL